MENENRFETIYRSHDPATAEMLEDVLIGEGYAPRLIGPRSASLLGVGQQIVDLRLEVPAGEAQAARELVEAVLAQGDYELEGDEEDEEAKDEPVAGDKEATEGPEGPRVDAPESASRDWYRPPQNLADGGKREPRAKGAKSRPTAKKRRIVAIGTALIFPGLAQVYARRGWAGLMLMTALAASFAVAIASLTPIFLTTAFFAALITDLVAGQMAVTAHNEGKETTPGRQVALGALEALGCLAAAFGVCYLIDA